MQLKIHGEVFFKPQALVCLKLNRKGKPVNSEQQKNVCLGFVIIS